MRRRRPLPNVYVMYRSAFASYLWQTMLTGLIVVTLPVLVYSGKSRKTCTNICSAIFSSKIQVHIPTSRSLHASFLAAEYSTARSCRSSMCYNFAGRRLCRKPARTHEAMGRVTRHQHASNFRKNGILQCRHLQVERVACLGYERHV